MSPVIEGRGGKAVFVPPVVRLTGMNIYRLIAGVVPHIVSTVVASGWCPINLIAFLPAARVKGQCVGPRNVIVSDSATVMIDI
jgi:uncharacterized Zn-binding protein involved in type VI secretion